MESTSSINSKNLQSIVNSMTGNDIRDMFSSFTFFKGKDYYDSGQVKSVKYENGGDQLLASVQGSQRYLVTVNLESGKLRDKCSCPIGGGCKHVVAALLYAVMEKDSVDIVQPTGNNNAIRSYLESLPQKELVDLVCRFAPEKFMNEISNKFSGSSEALAIFRKVEKATMKLLADVEYEDAPDDISSALGTQFAKLFGLEKHLKSELSGYILSVIEKVDEIQEEGYLYDDYNDDCFECPEEFTMLVRSYVKSLSVEDKIPFLRKLDAALTEIGHTGFEDLSSIAEGIFDVKELPGLKQYFIKNYRDLSSGLSEKYYNHVQKLLTEDEKERILSFLKDHYTHRLIELSSFYVSKGRKKESIEMIKKWLTGKTHGYHDEDVYIHYIDLVKDDESLLEKVCIEAITNCPKNTMLLKIEKTIRGETTLYEKILEGKYPSELLDYLESKGRLHEAMALIKRSKNIWIDRITSFYRKYKKVFKDDSIVFFSKVIKDNLQNTGDSYYAAIVDALQQIKELDPALTNKFITEIRTSYNRRRNLMAMLSKIG